MCLDGCNHGRVLGVLGVDIETLLLLLLLLLLTVPLQLSPLGHLVVVGVVGVRVG